MMWEHETVPRRLGSRRRLQILRRSSRAILWATLALPLSAQAQFAALGKRALPLGNDLTYTIVPGDLDGDGDTDIVIGARDRIRLHRNAGDGTFTDLTATALPTLGDGTGAALADIDGDGDLDLAVGHSGGGLHLLRNAGNGTFTDASANLPPFLFPIVTALAFADVDRDGDFDLVVGCVGQSLLLRNNNAGVFTDVSAAQLPSLFHTTRAVAAGDLDGDGDVDLVLGGGPYPGVPLPQAPTVVLRNLGSGTFQNSTATSLPPDNGVVSAVALADVDGDGDLDLAVGKEGLPRRLYRNLGTGTFVDVTTTNLPGVGATDFTNALAFGDVDRDGDLDLVCGNDDPVLGTGRQDRLFTNDGSGLFADATAQRLPVDDEPTQAVALCDVDGDLDLDLLVGNRSGNRLEANDGAGRFYDATASELPTAAGTTRGMALGEVDGDGNPDLLLAGVGLLFRNGGNGTFVDATAQLPALPQPSTAVVLGDVDGDGDLDAVFGSFGGTDRNRLLQNDGSGAFTDVTPGHLPTSGAQTNALALGDVDGDGDLDLVSGEGDAFVGAQSRLYRNDGTGTFTDVTATTLPLVGTFTDAIAAGDLDGDGDRDLVLVGNLAFQTRLLRNDGASGFTDVTTTQLPGPLDASVSVTLVDVDQDSDLDVVRGTRQGRGCHLYTNDGSGTFTDATAARLPSLNTPGFVVAGDVDADDDPDLLIAGTDLARLYRNLHHQLDAPFVLQLGRTWRLEAYVRAAPASQPTAVLPFFSTTRVQVRLPPFGTLGIDPNQMLALPPFLIAPSAGSGSLGITVPQVPALAGIVVHVQALFDYQPLGLHLSNVVTEVLRQ